MAARGARQPGAVAGAQLRLSRGGRRAAHRHARRSDFRAAGRGGAVELRRQPRGERHCRRAAELLPPPDLRDTMEQACCRVGCHARAGRARLAAPRRLDRAARTGETRWLGGGAVTRARRPSSPRKLRIEKSYRRSVVVLDRPGDRARRARRRRWRPGRSSAKRAEGRRSPRTAASAGNRRAAGVRSICAWMKRGECGWRATRGSSRPELFTDLSRGDCPGDPGAAATDSARSRTSASSPVRHRAAAASRTAAGDGEAAAGRDHVRQPSSRRRTGSSPRRFRWRAAPRPATERGIIGTT